MKEELKTELKKSLVINWFTENEVKGGTEVITTKLSKLFNSDILSYPLCCNLTNTQFKPYYNGSFINRGIIIEKYLTELVKFNKPDFIIRNSAIGGMNSPNVPTITIFQDPFKDIGKFLEKLNFSHIESDLLDEYIFTYPEFQKLTGKNSYNVAVSNFMADYMKDLGIECHRIIPHSVDYDLFKPGDISNDFFEEHNLDKDKISKYKKVGLWIGKAHPLKWHFMDKLIIENDDIYWICIFSYPVEGKPKSENVKFINAIPREKLVDFYNFADFLVCTSAVESFNLVALESLSCNTPVIAQRTGFFNDFNSCPGVLLCDNSLMDFKKAIKQLLETDIIADTRTLITEMYNYNGWKKSWENAVNEAIIHHNNQNI